MALTPLTIHEVAEAILGCVCAALNDVAEQVPGQPGCPTCRTCVVPGQAAADGCEDPCSGEAGGQLSVGLSRVWASTVSTFPSEDRTVRDLRECQAPVTAVEYVVTLLRCAPIPSDEGCPPGCDELTEAARVLHVDAFTVYEAVLCCVPQTSTARRGRRFVMGPQRVLGPQGGCVGVEQRVTVELPGCSPCQLVQGGT